ncbi:MAG: T9SS type A sorting domain-containing protein [Hyphomicrobiales bacterium]
MKKRLLSILVLLIPLLGFSQTELISTSFEGSDIPPEGWDLVYTSGFNSENNPVYSATSCYEGGSALCFKEKNTAKSYDVLLVTPDLTSFNIGSGHVLKFFTVSDKSNTFKIGYSSTGKELDDFTYFDKVYDVGLNVLLSEFKGHTVGGFPEGTKYICIRNYDEDNEGDGAWYLDLVSIVEAPPMEYESIELTQKFPKEIRQGGIDEAILKMKISVTGNGKPVKLSKLNFVMNGTTAISDVKKAKLFFTEDEEELDFENKVWESTGTLQNEFSADLENFYLNSGDNFIYLTYDISESAQDGNVIDAGCQSIVVSSIEENTTNTDVEGNRIIKSRLEGDIIVALDGSGQFTSLQEAFSHVNKYGIRGNTYIKLKAGTYNVDAKLDNVFSADSDKRLHITSFDNNAESVLLKPKSDVNAENIIELNNTSYIDFSKVSFIIDNDEERRAIKIIGDFNDIKIHDCIFSSLKPKDESDNSYKNAIIYVYHTENEGGLVIDNNVFKRGSYGVIIEDLSSDLDVNITNNTFENNYVDGLLLKNIKDLKVNNNTIITNEECSEFYCGLNIYSVRKRLFVFNNKINNTVFSKELTAINILMDKNEDTSEFEKGLIYNNIAQVTSSDGKATMLYMENLRKTTIAYNTFVKYEDQPESVIFMIKGDIEESLIRNNIFCDKGNGKVIYHDGRVKSENLSNNNVFHTNGTLFAKMGTKDFNNFEEWRAQTKGDEESKNINPSFISKEDLHVSDFALDFGIPIADVKLDFDGKSRDILVSTVGAYENDKVTKIEYYLDGSKFAGNEIAFGEVSQSVEMSKKLKVSNIGNKTISINNITTPDGFSIDIDKYPILIKPSKEYEIEIKLNSTTIKDYSGNLIIYIADFDNKTIALSAEVVEKPLPIVVAEFNEVKYQNNSEIDFGEIQDKSKSFEVRIKNIGNKELIADINASGDFEVSPSTINIGQNESVIINVKLKSTRLAEIPVQGKLTISSEDLTDDFVLNIKGLKIGLSEIDASTKIYPMPAFDVLNICFADYISGVVKLISINGITLKTISLNKENLIKINTRDLKSGMYLLNITTDKGRIFKKIMINN